MPSIAQLLASTPQPGQQQSDGDLMSTLSSVGGAGLGAVAAVGNFLDLPGSSVRDLLAGQGLSGSFDQWASPLSDANRTSGRQLLERFGMQSNKETGIGGWLSDPGEGFRDVAGFAAEVVLDPFGPVTKAAMGAKALAPAVSLAGRAHPMVKAVAKGAQQLFDILPGKVVKSALTGMTGTASRGIKALFNKSSEGITDKWVMPYAEQAREAATKWRQKASLELSELVRTSDQNGFHLTPDDTIDAADPNSMFDPKSLYRVRAREDQIRRAFEGTYDPNDMGIQPEDFVTVGDSATPREVEFLNQTPTGVQVKLIGDDKLYNDFDVKPHYLSAQEVIPQPVLDVIGRMKTEADSLRAQLKGFGYDLGEMIDPYVDYFHRRKSNRLRQAEATGGLDVPSWARSNHQSLVKTLSMPGGREMIYKAWKDGTPGINKMFNDPYFQKVMESLDGMSGGTEEVVNGVRSKIMPGYVGKRHVDELATSLGQTPDELWEELWQTRPVNKTGTVAYSTQPGVYDIVQGAGRVGQFGVRMIDDIAEITPTALDADSLDDAMQFIEHDLATKGTSRVDVKVTPEIGDVLKARGYNGTQILEDGSEVWSKPLFAAGAMKTEIPVMATTAELKSRLQALYDWKVTQVKSGTEKGVQPARGWWKSWTDLRPDANGNERVLNFDAKDFQPVDLPSLDAMRPLLPNVEDYDIIRANLEAGKEVLIGRRVPKKGKPAEFLAITPTVKAQVEGRFKRIMESLDDTVSSNPLTLKETTYDHLHQSITRNYGDKVDRWMPTLGERGVVEAVSEAGVEHSTGINGWHKTFEELMARGEKPTKPMRALLRLDDQSLKALMFRDEQIDELRNLRETEGLAQDVSIGLEDRHRALAEELGDHAERRYVPIFERSAGFSGYDYISRNGAALELVKSIRDFVVENVNFQTLEPDRLGVGQLSNDLKVKYNPADKMGMTLAEALDNGLFPERMNRRQFLESVRQKLVDDGKFTAVDDADEIAVDDADEIAKQINRIQSLKATSDTWTQLKTLNELSIGDLPELNAIQRNVGNVSTATKAGLLSISPATGIRDGYSSAFNATIMGGMNPLVWVGETARKAMSFIRGMPVDPGQGIKEIDEYLALRNLPNTAATRAEAFQNHWNAYTMSGSLHPNVVTADVARMTETDLTSQALDNAPKSPRLNDLVGGLKRTLLKPWKALDPRVAGTWTKDELGRVVQRSKGENPIVEFNNGLRGMIDSLVRSTYVMDRVAKTGSLTDAFAAADKFLLNADPRNFTRFENAYMKTAFPFYSFMRQSLPLFLGELMVNPGGKLGMTVRATRTGQGGSDEYVPYQYLDTAAIPLGESDEGELRYLTSFGLMHEDAIKYAGNALQRDARALMQQVLSSSSPIAKWFTEYSTNTSLFSQGPMGGRRLDDLDPNIGRILSNVGLQDVDASGRPRPVLGSPLLESLAAAGPASRIFSMGKIASDTRTSATAKVLRLLSGVRTEYVTNEQITRDLRDRLNAIQIAAGARPLTIVSGTEKLQEHLEKQGDTEKVEVLSRISKALAMQRKLAAQKQSVDSQ